MRRLGAALVLGALTTSTPALAQQQGGPEEADRRLDRLAERKGESTSPDLKPTLRSSGLDDDDDLLDPDLGAQRKSQAAPAQAMAPPADMPLSEKTRIDNAAADLGRAADLYGDELQELTRLMERDPQRGDAAVEERLRDAEARLASLQSQVAQLEQELARKEGRSDRRRVGDYGTPLDARTLPRGDARFANLQGARGGGQEQFAWWQRLLLKALDGVHKGVQKLAERRGNELKSRADALALSTDPAYRPYADWAVRDSVDSSRFAAARAYDPRLNDLLLPGARAAAPGPAPVTRAGAPAASTPTPVAGPGGPVLLLPRQRDPISGRTRVVIDMPLGGPFEAPIVGEPDPADETFEPAPETGGGPTNIVPVR